MPDNNVSQLLNSIIIKRKVFLENKLCSRFLLLRFTRHASSLQGNTSIGAKKQKQFFI
jgi:hypothetical protein